MGSLSFEIKARCPDPVSLRAILKAHKARFKGLDHQIDTYFQVPDGRLKLREGNIENALIYYKRDDQKRSKRCDSILWKPCEHKGQAVGECLSPLRSLKNILTEALGVLTVVDKKREIYLLKNTKFHIDRVKKLGSFVEVEVFQKGSLGTAKLKRQCEFYQKLFGIRTKDLVADSYSDLLLKTQRMEYVVFRRGRFFVPIPNKNGSSRFSVGHYTLI